MLVNTSPENLKIFDIRDDLGFNETALEIFRFQAVNCPIYRSFLEELKTDISKIYSVEEIPFLPISFFRTHKVITEGSKPEIIFTSSGTTGQATSSHFVAHKAIYEESFTKGFELFYGDPESYCILALLPGYMERSGSSLIYMMNDLISRSGNPDSGFYLYDHGKLEDVIMEQEAEGKKVLLLGVSFALLDFFENRKLNLKNTIIIETGGMKGRKKEIIREELHTILCEASGLQTIHSEYGMTELLSQAYSYGNGIFSTPPWMKILIRDTSDPFSYAPEGKTGGINVIDLANIYSCSFIATQDLGRTTDNKNTLVLGRFDNSDIRGCSLLL